MPKKSDRLKFPSGNWKEKLEHGSYLRIKRIGHCHYAYARSQGAWGSEEKYLGRCDSSGNIIPKSHRVRRNFW